MSRSATVLSLNGARPSIAELQALVLRSYGHYTSFIAQDAALRGWSLHQQRLQRDAQALFGIELDLAKLSEQLRDSLNTAGGHPQSVRISVLARAAHLGQLADALPVDVLISNCDWQAPANPALTLRSITAVREAPMYKHIGLSGALLARRTAQLNGADDALLLDSHGQIAEGPTWNLGMYDGQRLLWPSSPALPGTTQQLLMHALAAQEIPSVVTALGLGDLQQASCVFACNARQPVMPISGVDGLALARDLVFEARLLRAWQALPWQPI
jgi:branched-subunit amino acid aminotransferase/4-amino-4-deoxychorismate lyase